MELLEKYLDDPQRDEIIAREMGWSQLLDAKRNGTPKSMRFSRMRPNRRREEFADEESESKRGRGFRGA